MSKARELGELGTVVTVDGNNVGIGTASPQYPLHINGGGINNVLKLESTDAGAYANFIDDTSTVGTQIGAVGDVLSMRVGGNEILSVDSSTIEAGVGVDYKLRGGQALKSTGTINISADYDGSGAGVVQLATGGTTRVQVDEAGNFGLNNTNPTSLFHATVGSSADLTPYVFGTALNTFSNVYTSSSTTSNTPEGPHLLINSGQNTQNQTVGGGVMFGATTGNGTSVWHTINAVGGALGTHDSRLVFTRKTGANSYSETMRLTEDGDLLLGTTSINPHQNSSGTTADNGISLDAAGFVSSSRYNSAAGYFNRTSTDGEILQFRKDGTTVGSIGTKNSDLTIGTATNGLRFYDVGNDIIPWNVSTNAANDAAIDLGTGTERFKNLYLSGGVYLGGTGANNYLDDYEYGTWTPSMVAYEGTPTTWGEYFKIGRFVTASFNITLDGVTSDGSAWRIANLPFNWDNTVSGAWGGYISKQNTGLTWLSLQIVTANDVLIYNENGGTKSYTALGIGCEIRGAVSYVTT